MCIYLRPLIELTYYNINKCQMMNKKWLHSGSQRGTPLWLSLLCPLLARYRIKESSFFLSKWKEETRSTDKEEITRGITCLKLILVPQIVPYNCHHNLLTSMISAAKDSFR